MYRKLLHDYQAVRSQSRGECLDSAQAESFWSRLKTEVLELRERPVFTDLVYAQTSAANYFYYYKSRVFAFQYRLSDTLYRSPTDTSI